MRRALQIVITLALLAITTRSALAQTGGAQQDAQDPAAVVTAFVNAAASGNVDAALALLADNAALTLLTSQSFGAPAPDVYTGKAQIRTEFIESTPTGLQIVSVQASGNTATATLRSDADEQLRAMGLTEMGFVLVATVENGLIQSATLDFTPETKSVIQIISSGPAGPVVGMPATGAGDQMAALLGMALMGVVLAGTGLFLTRRRA
jgi:LPXTG-motif cell wall-anchored protein